jgi:hypothetical protein
MEDNIKVGLKAALDDINWFKNIKVFMTNKYTLYQHKNVKIIQMF